MALRREEAPLQRLGADTIDRRQHVGLVIRPQRADFDRPPIVKVLPGGISGWVHRRCAQMTSCQGLRRWVCRWRVHRLIWIKPRARTRAISAAPPPRIASFSRLLELLMAWNQGEFTFPPAVAGESEL